METKEFIRGLLERTATAITRAMDGLTPEEVAWRPSTECNSIGLILFHAARSEDSFVQGRIRGVPQIWESERWYEKLNMAASDTGSRYTREQVSR